MAVLAEDQAEVEALAGPPRPATVESVVLLKYCMVIVLLEEVVQPPPGQGGDAMTPLVSGGKC